MRGKEFLNEILTSYFTLVTLISIFMLVVGMYFYPDEKFGYIAFAYPLFYGACGILPEVVMYSKRELTVKEFVIRKLIQLILVEVFVLLAVFGGKEISAEEYDIIVITGIGIFVIYVIANVVSWIQKCLSAKKMTEDLVKLQRNFSRNSA